MRKIESIFRYLMIFAGMLVFLVMLNALVFMAIGLGTNSADAYVRVGKIAESLIGNRQAGYEMRPEGIAQIEFYQGFAMLIDGDTGQVIWEYQMPKELPREYSRKEIASFARWYLGDYPVYTWNIEEGIFVVGKQPGTVWKYNILYLMDTIEIYFKSFPWLILTDILLLLVVPVWVIRRQSRRREQQRTAWIAGVSHDIRTPLSIVLGMASALKQSSESEETMKKASVIEEQAVRMRTLITNLNTENKLSYAMETWSREEIVLASLVREILCDMMNRELGEQYEFEIDISEEIELKKVWGDRELLKRLLENLLNNSIQHNPDGCKITVKLQGGRYVGILLVEDTGCGVCEEQLQSMNKTVRSNQLPEHGLGIRLVKQIASRHYWRIRFEKNGEKGLRFTARFTVHR